MHGENEKPYQIVTGKTQRTLYEEGISVYGMKTFEKQCVNMIIRLGWLRTEINGVLF
jgi:hypothetical protein